MIAGGGISEVRFHTELTNGISSVAYGPRSRHVVFKYQDEEYITFSGYRDRHEFKSISFSSRINRKYIVVDLTLVDMGLVHYPYPHDKEGKRKPEPRNHKMTLQVSAGLYMNYLLAAGKLL